jgi:hypothetical protein
MTVSDLTDDELRALGKRLHDPDGEITLPEAQLAALLSEVQRHRLLARADAIEGFALIVHAPELTPAQIARIRDLAPRLAVYVTERADGAYDTRVILRDGEDDGAVH